MFNLCKHCCKRRLTARNFIGAPLVDDGRVFSSANILEEVSTTGIAMSLARGLNDYKLPEAIL